MNQKILQENQNFPTVTLKDGTPVQTGTVAALLYNIQRYNGGQIEEEMRLAIPILFKIGFFELFPPNEWISKENFGRNFVGHAAQAYLIYKPTYLCWLSSILHQLTF